MEQLKKYMNLTKLLSLCLLLALITSCEKTENDNPDPKPPIPGDSTEVTTREVSRLLILSEGLFNYNNSTLACYTFEDKDLNTNWFGSINRRGLGDTANDMKVYGSKLYIVVNVSSQVEIVDLNTGKSLKQIPMFNDANIARQPRYIDFYEDKAYVCSFDGTVARIDTASMKVEAYVTCGRNPDGICVANKKLYVSNSGGLDFPNYDKTVSVVDIASFTEKKKIEVGINPSKLKADSQGDVYVVSRGDYETVPYVLQRIDSKTDELVQTFDDINALNLVISNDIAYIYNYDFDTKTSWVKVFDCITEKVVRENFITDNTVIKTPYGINVNPENGDVYITEAYGFTERGDLLCFSSEGKFKYRINQVGLNPNTTLFVRATVEE